MRLLLLTALLVALHVSAPGRAVEAPEYRLEELVRFGIAEGCLAADFSIPQQLLQSEPTAIRIRGSNAKWTLREGTQMPRGYYGNEHRVIELGYEDAGDRRREGHVKATLFSSGGQIVITARIRIEGQEVAVLFQGRRDYGSAQLEATARKEQEWMEPIATVYADNLLGLFEQHGMEVDLYLAPILKKMTQRNLLGPGAADVYGAFEAIQPDARSEAAVERLLAGLDSPDPADRQRATRMLEKLGDAGVLAAMRADGEWLSPEQRSRLRAFVVSHRHRRLLTVDEARGDVGFLMECLEHDDARVRAAAKQRIESLIGRNIEYDPGAGFDARYTAVQRLQSSIR